jgi:uncharacterized protein
MIEQFCVGHVSAVRGTKVKAFIKPHLNKMSYFFSGEIYRGISINEFILIRKGYIDLIGKIEGEEVIEPKILPEGTPIHKSYDRYIEINILGYFENNLFNQGIKYLPMIGDDLYLVNTRRLDQLYDYTGRNKNTNVNGVKESNEDSIELGKTLSEGNVINIPINSVFASHIGIFGNTGSGKSNTLAKLYMSLFEKKVQQFKNKSSFVLIDFNGEYENIYNKYEAYANYLNLSTYERNGQQKLQISATEFWDAELLSVLYSASEKTQTPFLKHLVNSRNRSISYNDQIPLTSYFKKTFDNIFGVNQHKETLTILHSLLKEIDTEATNNLSNLLTAIGISWNATTSNYIFNSKAGGYLNSVNDIKNKLSNYCTTTNIQAVDIDNFNLQAEVDSQNNPFLEVMVRAQLQLINSTTNNFIQYEHISPLISKISAVQKDLKKVIEIVDSLDVASQKPIQILSLRNCNAIMKKTIAMLLAKTHFNHHKAIVDSLPDGQSKSFHLIIDEAHNILSEQSTREANSWKDYRLELFEEIIKEGRKFGFFITIASQRPADISPTIISQLHNYFLHRLVNENDLNLLKNAISTLDSNDRSQIPKLPAGACVVSGVAFHMPVVLQVDRLPKDKAPNSDTINLINLWQHNI